MSQKEYRKFELLWAQNKLAEVMKHLRNIDLTNVKNEDLLTDAQWHVFSALLKVRDLRRNLR